jgi:membrane protease YdiL (CAAX protease family)
MNCTLDQLCITEPLLSVDLTREKRNSSALLKISLLRQTIVVTTIAILAIRLLIESPISKITWFLAPAILVSAALIPMAIRKSESTIYIGFGIGNAGFAALTVLRTYIVVFPILFVTSWIMKSRGLSLPLQAALPEAQSWFSWLLYQFIYVAVAEEVFFRGYVLNNILEITTTDKCKNQQLHNWLCIIISAAVFSAAHVIVQGRIIAVVTFLPGLVLGWLFIRTRSLLAPILFHGLANASYCVMACALV